MPLPGDGRARRRRTCEWITRTEALRHFATYDGATQSQQHIKPLHWYVACRLVLEGGFHPDELTPRPPFSVTDRRGRHFLHYSPETATGSEATLLGGLKTKNVDIVIDKPGVGPVLAVSCKGMTGAFRNLTNRMEETIGECTNLHIRYPALVFGYLFVIRANRVSDLAGARSRTAYPPPVNSAPTTLRSTRTESRLKRSPVSMPRWELSPVATAFAPTPADTRRSHSRWSMCGAARPET